MNTQLKPLLFVFNSNSERILFSIEFATQLSDSQFTE